MFLLNVIVIGLLMLVGCSADTEYNNTLSRSYKGSHCMGKEDCYDLLGLKSLCIAHECQCIPHYHINNYNRCIKDRGLKEICQSNDECYWGPEMIDRIECSLGVCSCVPGYFPDHGRNCIKYFPSSATVVQTLSSLIFIIITTVAFI